MRRTPTGGEPHVPPRRSRTFTAVSRHPVAEHSEHDGVVSVDGTLGNPRHEQRAARTDGLRRIGDDVTPGNRPAGSLPGRPHRLRGPRSRLRLLRDLQRRGVHRTAARGARPHGPRRARTARLHENLHPRRRALHQAAPARALRRSPAAPRVSPRVRRPRAARRRRDHVADRARRSETTGHAFAPDRPSLGTARPARSDRAHASPRRRARHRHLFVRTRLGLRPGVPQGRRVLHLVLRLPPRHQPSAPRELPGVVQEHLPEAPEMPDRGVRLPARSGGRMPLWPMRRDGSAIAPAPSRAVRRRMRRSAFSASSRRRTRRSSRDPR